MQRRHYDALAPRLDEVGSLRRVLVFEGEAPDDAIGYESALAQAPIDDPQVPLGPDDPHIIRFSAGTTGKAKGILHTPKAVVVLRPGHHAGEQELIDWTREKLGAVKRVTSVEFVDELPKSPLGKVLRRDVRDRSARSRRACTAPDPDGLG